MYCDVNQKEFTMTLKCDEDPQKYRSPENQITLLKSRGLNFENIDAAEKILRRINYYNLINPFGKPFLVKNTSEQGDKYINEAYFEQIYSFYNFDKNLSMLFLRRLLQIESSFKSIISHVISSKTNNCHKHQIYLSQSIFEVVKNEREKENNQKLLDSLADKINNSNKIYIKHNLKRYNNVPFWVLSNDMTFAETIYYYQKLSEQDKNKISFYMRGENKEVKVTLKQFQSILYILKDLRNLLAHNEVIYWFKPLGLNGKSRYYSLNKYKGVNSQEGSLAIIMLAFNMYLFPDDWNLFYYEFKKELNSFKNKVPSFVFQEVLSSMGFFKVLNKKYPDFEMSVTDLDSLYS